MADPTVIWSEDAGSRCDPPPRTDPPRNAEAQADVIFDRVAGGTRVRRKPRRKWSWVRFVVGPACLLAAAYLYWNRTDTLWLYAVLIGLAVAGLVLLLQGVMGVRE